MIHQLYIGVGVAFFITVLMVLLNMGHHESRPKSRKVLSPEQARKRREQLRKDVAKARDAKDKADTNVEKLVSRRLRQVPPEVMKEAERKQRAADTKLTRLAAELEELELTQ